MFQCITSAADFDFTLNTLDGFGPISLILPTTELKVAQKLQITVFFQQLKKTVGSIQRNFQISSPFHCSSSSTSRYTKHLNLQWSELILKNGSVSFCLPALSYLQPWFEHKNGHGSGILKIIIQIELYLQNWVIPLIVLLFILFHISTFETFLAKLYSNNNV